MYNLFVLQWGKDFADNYNYGAQIELLENRFISYVQPLMSPGATIKKWFSMISSTNPKNSPMLPLLKNGKSYNFHLHLDAVAASTWQVKIEYFDRFGNILDSKYYNELNGTFTYPTIAVSYTIELINIKEEDFVFKYLVLTDSDLDEIYDIEIDESLSLVNLLKRSSPVQDTHEVTVQRGKKNTFSLHIAEEADRNYSFVIDRMIKDFPEDISQKIYHKVKEHEVKNLHIKHGGNFLNVKEYYQNIPKELLEMAKRDDLVAFEHR
jgi:accessory Sec system protein Asp3